MRPAHTRTLRIAARGLLVAVLAMVLAPAAHAEPYLAIASGHKCVACHVNPTGGGLRTAYGLAYAQAVMPAASLPSGVPTWTGRIGDHIRVGGDLRYAWSRTEVPAQPSQQRWAFDHVRLYADVAMIPDRLAFYVDQQLAPGSSTAQEAYVRLSTPDGSWYAKGGQFYLPFGWRLEDDSAFVRQTSGINMTAPDTGIEAGIEGSLGSAQVAVSNGSDTSSGSGRQMVAQAVWVRSDWRLGGAAAYTRAEAGNRRMLGVFGGLRTGPLAWLAEVDLVRDAGYPEGTRTLLAGLGEVNWAVMRGHNLKLTSEYLDPDRNVREDHKTRLSLVWEFTPLPYLQLRAGVRRWDGIPQNALDNRRLVFFEIHGFM